MSLTKKRKREIEAEEKYRNSVAANITLGQNTSSQKNGVPLILSFFIPGLGQLVKGQVKKGLLIFFCPVIAFFVIIILGIAMGNTNGSIVWSLVGYGWLGYIILYIWQLIDAYNN